MLSDKYFKTKIACERAKLFHPVLYDIMTEMVLWIEKRNLTPLITATVTTSVEDKEDGRVFDGHRCGRCFDLSVRGWSDADRKDFEAEFKKYSHMGAVSMSDKKQRLIVYEKKEINSTGPHFHIQFSKGFAVFGGNEKEILV